VIDYTPTEPLLVVEVDADVCLTTTAGGTRRDSNGYEQSCIRWTFRHHVIATTDELWAQPACSR